MADQSLDLNLHEERTSWRSWTEPWYFSYGLLGVSAAGMAPILLPLAVGRQGDLTKVGLVMAVFNLGGFLAPLWGGLADRRHCYRLILIGGLVATAIGFAFFPFSTSLPVRSLLALVGFLFIVLAWSLLSVTGTAVTARLARSGEGEALGLFNATTAIAGVLGSALGGWLASRWGYTAITAMGVVGITLGILILIGILKNNHHRQVSETLNKELSS